MRWSGMLSCEPLLIVVLVAAGGLAGARGLLAAEAVNFAQDPRDGQEGAAPEPETPDEPKVVKATGFSDEAVQQAIDRACRFLWSQQQADGSWAGHGGYPDGPAALAAYALLASGVSPMEEPMAKALDWLSKQESMKTYCLGLRCNVWLLANKPTGGKYMQNLREEVTRLIRSTKDGSYNYNSRGDGTSSGDHSNSQFGVLGVWAGDMAMGEVPLQYWRMVMDHWRGAQYDDGGWSYRGGGKGAARGKGGSSTPTMTAAGLATVFVCFDRLFAEQFLTCRAHADFGPLKLGPDWMDRHFAGKGGGFRSGRSYYLLYGVERVGLASGYKYFGKTDWYKVGAEQLLGSQAASGAWGNVVNTSFALLFLVRGQHPVAFNKLEFDGDWNNRPRDLAGLTRWQSAALERTLNWQIITLKAPVEEWHDAPVLYLSGSREPKFTDEQLDKLRRFVWQGGAILSVTACGGRAYSTAIREACAKMFPDLPLAPVPADHELYGIHYRLRGKPPLQMVHNGIRPLVIHTEADLARSWQLQLGRTDTSAFEAATNILMYVTDRGDLRRRGVSPWPPPSAAKPARTIRLARLKYAGPWDPEPLAYERFSRLMALRAGWNLEVAAGVEIAELTPGAAAVATLTGTRAFRLGEAEKAALKRFVEGGGTLVIDAAGGATEFAESADLLVRELFGRTSLRMLAAGAEVFRLPKMGIEKVSYRRKARVIVGGSHVPSLRGVTVGGRVGVLFSKEDLTGGLVGCAGDFVGYRGDSCFELMRNIVVYAAGRKPAPVATPPPKPGPGANLSADPADERR